MLKFIKGSFYIYVLQKCHFYLRSFNNKSVAQNCRKKGQATCASSHSLNCHCNHCMYTVGYAISMTLGTGVVWNATDSA